jgi:hypothetical protein
MKLTIAELPRKAQAAIRRRLSKGQPLGMARAADVASCQVQIVTKPAPLCAPQKP